MKKNEVNPKWCRNRAIKRLNCHKKFLNGKKVNPSWG